MNLGCLFCFLKRDDEIVIEKVEKKQNTHFFKRETIAISSEYCELKYWFNELLKYVINDYEQYGNKENLLETVWKYIDIITVSKYHNIYKTTYSGEYSKKNMIEFYNYIKNTEFEKEILELSNICRFH